MWATSSRVLAEIDFPPLDESTAGEKERAHAKTLCNQLIAARKISKENSTSASPSRESDMESENGIDFSPENSTIMAGNWSLAQLKSRREPKLERKVRALTNEETAVFSHRTL